MCLPLSSGSGVKAKECWVTGLRARLEWRIRTAIGNSGSEQDGGGGRCDFNAERPFYHHTTTTTILL